MTETEGKIINAILFQQRRNDGLNRFQLENS